MTDVPATHPLDPLTAAEIRQVAGKLRRERGVEPPAWRFASIELLEPDKEALQEPGDRWPPRAAQAVCWNREDGRTYRGLVSLPGRAPSADGAVTGWEHLPGVQPNMTLDEWHECDEMLRTHPQVVAALVPERYRGLRLGWSDVWRRGSPEGDPYAHHVTGLHPVVDLNAMALLELEDAPGGEPAAADPPDVMGEYLPALIGMPLREVKPLHVSQPEGPSFTLRGQELTWQNWELRLGFDHREGLVLHTVGFRARGRLRPVAHRLSFAEMIVPYRDATRDGHTLWVTPHRPDERWPCGDFPNLSERDAGLPRWTAQNRSIENADVVLWYVFGIHHITRPEDWPVMPVDTVSFWLKPFGFFDRNPALDVPPGPPG